MTDFFRGTTPELRVAFFAFLIGLAGVGFGFLGFAIEIRAVSVLGYCTTVLAIAIGFGSISWGWARIILQMTRKIIEAGKRINRKNK